MSAQAARQTPRLYASLRPFDQVTDLPRLPHGARTSPRQNPILVPIAPVEMIHLAQRFPLAFRRDGDGWDIVAVTGLETSQRHLIASDDPRGGILPILLQTYPLAIVDDGQSEEQPILVDETMLALGSFKRTPEEQEDIEETVERHCQSLWAFINSRRAAKPILASLDTFAALRRWDLYFTRDEEKVGISGLYYLDWDFMGTQDHRDVVRTHGYTAAEIIAAQRISQHRVNDLLHDLA